MIFLLQYHHVTDIIRASILAICRAGLRHNHFQMNFHLTVGPLTLHLQLAMGTSASNTSYIQSLTVQPYFKRMQQLSVEQSTASSWPIHVKRVRPRKAHR